MCVPTTNTCHHRQFYMVIQSTHAPTHAKTEKKTGQVLAMIEKQEI